MFDAGTAPCVDQGVLSLAICKPKIRGTAESGDWIFGFGAKSRLGERLIYIAQVSEVLPKGDYYRSTQFSGRKDCIYRWTGPRLQQMRNSVHRPSECHKDIGQPPGYEGATVLMSKNFRYFGCSPTKQFTDSAPLLMKYVSTVKQGHRVHFPAPVTAELEALANAIWKAYPDCQVVGSPTDKSGCDA